MVTFKELREQSGMNKTKFAEYFEIPYRTVQNWEAVVNKCPDYLLNLMEYKLKHEGLIQEDMEKK
jgi:DNA-binding transcriptional regulator YiaG